MLIPNKRSKRTITKKTITHDENTKNGNNRGSKHLSITRKAAIITVSHTTNTLHTDFTICVQATRAHVCVYQCVCVCVS